MNSVQYAKLCVAEEVLSARVKTAIEKAF